MEEEPRDRTYAACVYIYIYIHADSSYADCYANSFTSLVAFKTRLLWTDALPHCLDETISVVSTDFWL